LITDENVWHGLDGKDVHIAYDGLRCFETLSISVRTVPIRKQVGGNLIDQHTCKVIDDEQQWRKDRKGRI